MGTSTRRPVLQMEMAPCALAVPSSWRVQVFASRRDREDSGPPRVSWRIWALSCVRAAAAGPGEEALLMAFPDSPECFHL